MHASWYHSCHLESVLQEEEVVTNQKVSQQEMDLLVPSLGYRFTR
jgi:hypothetical protein